MKTCSVEGCDNNSRSNGYCSKHYQQIYRCGKILPKFRIFKNHNEIILYENHAEIVLKNKQQEEVGRVLIDLEDVERCKEYRWCLSHGYACTSLKRRTTLGIHRFLLLANDYNIFVDHINHNTLDNRKENLRLVNRSESACNTLKRKNCSSKYKGVYWCKTHKKWKGQISFNKNHYSVGYFKTEEEAALAYDKKAEELHGEFACLNGVN